MENLIFANTQYLKKEVEHLTTNTTLYFLHAPQSAIHPWPIEVHGILAHNLINSYNGCYALEDLILETWLNHEKERTGVYPYWDIIQ